MMFIYKFFVRHKKIIISSIFFLIFLFSLIMNIPSWVLSSSIKKYSHERLRLYDTQGTFWHGSGLIVAYEPVTKHSAPLILLNWKIKLGLTKFIDLQFFVGDNTIANIFIDKTGINLNNLNLSLSIAQVSEIFSLIKSFDLAGNIHITTTGVHLGNNLQGKFDILLNNLSSNRSPINPLGDYTINFSLADYAVNISSNPNSTLVLSGIGNLNNLSLNARVANEKKEKMLQFISIIGIPQYDGSYLIKVFPQ